VPDVLLARLWRAKLGRRDGELAAVATEARNRQFLRIARLAAVTRN
jgi:hypothetical protein